jgi:microcystin-dependent protein
MAKIMNVHTSGAVGTIIDCPIISPLPGTLFCFGQTLNAVTNPIYQPLFNAIGNQYGGSDNTNFVIPDLRGFATAGKDNMGGVSANRLTVGGSGIVGTTLGATGGSETHALSVAELAAHDHRAAGGTGGSTLPWNNAGGSAFCALSSTGVTFQNTFNNGQQALENTGSGTAHTSTQPTHIVNKAICYY